MHAEKQDILQGNARVKEKEKVKGTKVMGRKEERAVRDPVILEDIKERVKPKVLGKANRSEKGIKVLAGSVGEWDTNRSSARREATSK